LAASSIRQVHWILSGAYKRAVRWRWVAHNPLTETEPPAPPRPDPRPPSAGEAAQILLEASSDPDWATFIWLAMTTGARRGELCALRLRHVDLDNAAINLRASVGQIGTRVWEKDTKTHQQRRVAIDPDTVEVLRMHLARAEEEAAAIGATLGPDSFVFSLMPDHSTHLVPSSVTQRFRKLAARLGLDTHIHQLRHYSATELISAGVDIRTVAGRLGHAGGGTTTLRVYAAWMAEADQRAAAALTPRMPGGSRPGLTIRRRSHQARTDSSPTHCGPRSRRAPSARATRSRLSMNSLRVIVSLSAQPTARWQSSRTKALSTLGEVSAQSSVTLTKTQPDWSGGRSGDACRQRQLISPSKRSKGTSYRSGLEDRVSVGETTSTMSISTRN
jgi:integrase